MPAIVPEQLVLFELLTILVLVKPLYITVYRGTIHITPPFFEYIEDRFQAVLKIHFFHFNGIFWLFALCKCHETNVPTCVLVFKIILNNTLSMSLRVHLGLYCELLIEVPNGCAGMTFFVLQQRGNQDVRCLLVRVLACVEPRVRASA